MQSLFIFAVLLVAAFGASQAFLFTNNNNQIARSNGQEVDQTCLDKADEGDCEFYTCFENRLSCGREGYATKFGHFYCNRMERMIETFSDDAQTFIRDSKKCMMQALKDLYQEDSIECHDLSHVAVQAISRCFMDNAFCSALHGNFQEFFQIYEVNDLFSSGAAKVWREIARLARGCGGEAFSSLATDVKVHLENFANTAQDAFSSASDHVSGAMDTAHSHLSNFASNAGDALEDAGEEVSDALSNAADEVRDSFSNLFNWKKK